MNMYFEKRFQLHYNLFCQQREEMGLLKDREVRLTPLES